MVPRLRQVLDGVSVEGDQDGVNAGQDIEVVKQ
jgi:hypothetical protein